MLKPSINGAVIQTFGSELSGLRTAMTSEACTNCGLAGHARSNCPRPKGGGFAPANAQAAAKETKSKEKEKQPKKDAQKKASANRPAAAPSSVPAGASAMPYAPLDGGGVCFDFTKGKCTRGEGCRFSHDLSLASAPAQSKGGICFDFTKGQCNRGETCRFSHDMPTSAPVVKNAGICFDFTRGVCMRGEMCRFSHDMNVARTSQAAASTRGICFDFAKGQCTRGVGCRFSHDLSAEGGPGAAGARAALGAAQGPGLGTAPVAAMVQPSGAIPTPQQQQQQPAAGAGGGPSPPLSGSPGAGGGMSFAAMAGRLAATDTEEAVRARSAAVEVPGNVGAGGVGPGVAATPMVPVTIPGGGGLYNTATPTVIQ
ncbi:hypothetical protein CYMTET_24100, partial [Cymbomonas tetramitiformis]